MAVEEDNDAAADLLSRVQAMEEQVRQLRGRIDETQNLITRQNADLSKQIDDLTFQLNLQPRQGRGRSAPACLFSVWTRSDRRRYARSRRVRICPESAGAEHAAAVDPEMAGWPTVAVPNHRRPRHRGASPFNQAPEPMRETQPPPAPAGAASTRARPVPHRPPRPPAVTG